MTIDATYPANPDGSSGGGCRIDYVKCVLPAGLSWDLQSCQLRDREFPATSTKYELYTEFDFEAYRRLGWSLVHDAESKHWADQQETEAMIPPTAGEPVSREAAPGVPAVRSASGAARTENATR